MQILREETEKQRKEADKARQERDKAFKELAKRMNRFDSEWGKFVESLVSGNLVHLLRLRNIDVSQTSTSVEVTKRDKSGLLWEREFDIIAANGHEVVAVEVKTTLNVKKVDHFLKTLEKFKWLLPQYKAYKIYGALAYLKSSEQAELYAQRKGLFVIRATGDSASIINKKDF